MIIEVECGIGDGTVANHENVIWNIAPERCGYGIPRLDISKKTENIAK